MEKAIKEYCNKYHLKYIPIPDNSIGRIYNLLIKDTFTEPLTDIEMLYYGIYYKGQKEYKNMLKYYLIAIEAGNSDAMDSLGYYYQHKKKDYNKMLKYYLMAIEAGNSDAMFHLGYYYSQHLNRKKMLKYYLMATEAGNSHAMYKLGYYYQWIKIDYDKMLTYYLMAIETADHIDAMNRLVSYYETQNNYSAIIELFIKIKNYKNFQETLEYMIKHDKSYNEQIIQYIIEYGHNFTDDCHFLLKQHYNLLKQKIDLMDLHFKYTDNGLGMKEAKEDFILQLNVKN